MPKRREIIADLLKSAQSIIHLCILEALYFIHSK